MDRTKKKWLARQRRHQRVRKHISGTPERPRLNVYRSLNEIYGQIIDDVAGHTLVSASTIDREVRPLVEGKTKTEQARVVGGFLARRALDRGIKQVVFDRGGWAFHGRIQALADAAREEGLEF
jgi:large subunit ribosomal protein L18